MAKDKPGILGKIKDKITSVSGIISGFCAIVAFLWLVFKEVSSYNNVKISDKTQSAQIDSLAKRVSVLETELKESNSSRNLDAFDLGISYEILVYNMPDYYWDGIRYKTSLDGKKFYYYVKGILYRATWDATNQKFFYYAEDGKTYWCK